VVQFGRLVKAKGFIIKTFPNGKTLYYIMIWDIISGTLLSNLGQNIYSYINSHKSNCKYITL
jgi:hypothetical protein